MAYYKCNVLYREINDLRITRFFLDGGFALLQQAYSPILLIIKMRPLLVLYPASSTFACPFEKKQIALLKKPVNESISLPYAIIVQKNLVKR
jgi:hypothetical protein